MITMKELSKIYKDADSFIDYLPWLEYEDGYYVLIDGAIGQMYEIECLSSDLMDEKSLEYVAQNLETLFLRLPEETAMQFILMCDDDVEGKLGEFAKKASSGSVGSGDAGSSDTSSGTAQVIKEAIKSKIGKLREGTKKNMLPKQGEFYTKRIRLFFTIGETSNLTNFRIVEKIKGFIGNEIKSGIKDIAEQNKISLEKKCNICEGVFKNADLGFKKCPPETLVKLVYNLLNPTRYKGIKDVNYDPDRFIRDQVLFSSVETNGYGPKFEGVQYNIVSMKTLPKETFPGMLTGEFETGGKSVSMLDLIQDFTLVLNIKIEDQKKAVSRMGKQRGLMHLQRFNLLGHKSVDAEISAREMDETMSRIHVGKRVVSCRFQFLVREKKEDVLENLCNEINNMIHKVFAEGTREDVIGSSLFLQCLPFNFSDKYERFICRGRTLLSDNLAEMLPVYGSFRGTKTPAQIYQNRRGEAVFFDFFDSETAAHGLLAGVTGSGKSFFTNDIITQNLRLGSQIFVLDKGDSYKKLCSMYNGAYIAFDPNKPLCINPFDGELDNERLSYLVMLISEMASGGDERERVTREQSAIIQESIRAVYKEKKKDIVLTDIAKKLGESKQGKLIARKMSPFLAGNQFGGFFDGKTEINIDNNFVVFELGLLDTYKDLQSVMLLSIMYFITKQVAGAKLKNARKYFFIDEAWSLLNTENTAQFLENAFRTFRKYGCSVIAITQQTADFTRTKAGEAIRANTANKILLRQSGDVIARMQSDLDLSKKEVDKLKSVTTVKGAYSEAFIKTENVSGIVRYVPDSFSYWLYTSDSKDNRELNKYIKEYGGIVKAINKIREKYPYGVR